MRVLALDLGGKRIGVAVSDRSGTIAAPLTVLQRSGDIRRDHEQIRKLIVEEEAELLVVGMPISMNGTMGPAAQAAATEIEQMATVVGVPVDTLDERLTTVTANRMLAERGVRGPERRKVIDKIAAAVILQTWLDGHSENC